LRELHLPLPGVRALAQARMQLPRAGRARVDALVARTTALAHNLAHLNPAAVLDRGYAIVARGDGAIVQDAAQLRVGDTVQMTFARGDAQGSVTATSAPTPATSA
jgi:exodeoxyribonuclease VII large subunit